MDKNFVFTSNYFENTNKALIGQNSFRACSSCKFDRFADNSPARPLNSKKQTKGVSEHIGYSRRRVGGV